MEYLVQFQINIFGLMILLVLYLFVRMSKIKTYSKLLIRLIIVTTTIAVIAEPLTWIFDGMGFRGASILEYGTNFLLFLMGPVIGGLLLSYVDFHIFKDQRRIHKKIFYQHLSIITLVILIINIFYPLYFKVNPLTNSYSSGDFKEAHYIVLGGIYLYMLFFIWKNRYKTTLKEAIIFFICFLIPIVGMVIQIFDSKLHFSWTSIVLGLLVIYVFLETTPSEEDFLTKLYNRASYETYLLHLTQSGKDFGIIIFDLNYFKDINDRYGHNKGDEVLIEFARILKRIFSKRGMVARLGGDEFSIILDRDLERVDELMNSISQEICKNRDQVISQLSFSYGYQEHRDDMTIDDMYIAADEKMYTYKEKVKNR